MAAFKALIPFSWPIMSSKFLGLLFSVKGSVKHILFNFLSFSISFVLSLFNCNLR